MTAGGTTPLDRLLGIVHRVEDAMLAGLLAIMIIFAAAQILLRNLFDTGIVWADPLLRVLVLWIGLVGAMVASRADNHIAVNVLSRFLPPRIKAAAGAAVALFTAVVCAVIAYHAARFVAAEYGSGVHAFGDVPVWLAESIMPIGFAVIAVRYALLSIVRVRTLRARSANP